MSKSYPVILHICVWQDNCTITPVVSDSSANFIEGLVKDAESKGAKLMQKYKREGNLIWPVLIDNVTSVSPLLDQSQLPCPSAETVHACQCTWRFSMVKMRHMLQQQLCRDSGQQHDAELAFKSGLSHSMHVQWLSAQTLRGGLEGSSRAACAGSWHIRALTEAHWELMCRTCALPGKSHSGLWCPSSASSQWKRALSTATPTTWPCRQVNQLLQDQMRSPAAASLAA